MSVSYRMNSYTILISEQDFGCSLLTMEYIFFFNISIFDKNKTIGCQVKFSYRLSFQDYFHRKYLQSSLKIVCLFLYRLHLLPWSLLEKISKPKTKLTSKRLPRLINLGQAMTASKQTLTELTMLIMVIFLQTLLKKLVI